MGETAADARHTTDAPGDAAADEDLLRQFTGQTAVRDIAAAHGWLDGAREDEQLAARRTRAEKAGLTVAAFRYHVARFGTLPVFDALVMSSAFAVLVCALLIAAGASATTIAVMLAVSWLLFGGGLWWILYDGASETRAERIARCAATLQAQRARFAEAKRASDQRARDVANAMVLVEGVEQATKATLRRRMRLDEIDALLRVDCASLDGPEFERHLAEAFRLHGYHVTLTGQSGDQGVDLIVTRGGGGNAGGRRIAVQAKCYAGSVGNDAVQQAFAGMAFHGCQACAVITNSEFTRSAKALASKIGCMTVDGAALRRMIAEGFTL
jgi:HJR/Mrr/RecB family endonuclease